VLAFTPSGHESTPRVLEFTPSGHESTPRVHEFTPQLCSCLSRPSPEGGENQQGANRLQRQVAFFHAGATEQRVARQVCNLSRIYGFPYDIFG
jgi:hypothetical protein